MSDLQGRSAIVTGAASGIGAAAAKALGAAGAAVLLGDIDVARAKAVAEEIVAAGGQAAATHLDVADGAGHADFVAEAVSRFGRLDIAHLNAGRGAMHSVLDVTPEAWEFTMSVNLTGVMFGLQAAARRMVDQGHGGAIIVTSSAAGLRGVRNSVAYCASKHAVIGVVRSAALDLAAAGVRVNAICPGLIETPLLAPLQGQPEVLSRMAASHPLGRMGRPEEVGRLVAYLAGDDAAFITGAALSIDGGLTAS